MMIDLILAILSILILGQMIGLLWINHKLKLEMQRNHILQSFIAGIIRTISDYKSSSDRIDEDDLPDRATQLPIPYQVVLENINWELSKDTLLANYEEWLKKNRNLFFDDRNYTGDGFNFIYLDLFDKLINDWYSGELMSPKKREWLSEEIEVTEENVDELKGEIGMLKDLINGKLDSSIYTPENIDEKFAHMFNHIQYERLQEAKRTILSRNNQ